MNRNKFENEPYVPPEETENTYVIGKERLYNPSKPTQQSGNRMCETCVKQDVCSIRDDTDEARSDIINITGRVNVFIDVGVDCQKYVEKTVQYGTR